MPVISSTSSVSSRMCLKLKFVTLYQACTAHVEHVVKEKEFCHSFCEGITLLQSCKQIYYEAAGILYGSNTFLFSQAINQLRSDLYNLHKSAVKWLADIRLHHSLLSHVQIDAAGFDTGNRGGHKDYNLLPLLEHI